MSKAKGNRDVQLAEDWQWLNNTPQGRRIIADLMVWGNVYTQITGYDARGRAMSNTEIFMAIGENNFAKRIAGYLGYKPDPYQFVQHAQDDTDLLNRMILSSQQH